MKNKFIALVALICCLTMSIGSTACIGDTTHGACIGLADDGEENLQYRPSIWNAIVAFVFIETIVVPVVWFLAYAKCPVAVKHVTPKN